MNSGGEMNKFLDAFERYQEHEIEYLELMDYIRHNLGYSLDKRNNIPKRVRELIDEGSDLLNNGARIGNSRNYEAAKLEKLTEKFSEVNLGIKEFISENER